MTALVLSAMLLLAGCGSAEGGATTTETGQAVPSPAGAGVAGDGGVLNIAFIPGQDDSLDSTPSPGSTAEATSTPENDVGTSPWNPLCPLNREMVDMYSLMFEGLIRYDSAQRVIPALAERWEYDEAGTKLTMHIRKNVKFHNGQTLKAEDVVHTFSLLNQYLNIYGHKSIYKKVMKYISSVNATDEYTIEINTNGRDMRVLYALNFPIVPSSYTGPNSNGDIPAGTGPYKITSNNNGRTIEMGANTDWWRQQPHIKKVVAKAMPDSDTCLSALEAREVDLVHTTSLTADRFKKEGVTKAMELNTNLYECLIVNVNTGKRPLDNKYFREALISSIDRKAIISEVYLSHAVSVDSPIPPDSHLFNSGQTQHDYNPAHANEIISRMNFEDKNEDGLLERKGSEVAFELTLLVAENPLQNTRVDVAEMIAEQLKKIGITVKVDTRSWSEYMSALNKGEFDLALGGFSVGLDGDLSFLTHSKDADHKYGGYLNFEMDQMLESYIESIEEQEQQAGSADLQEVFATEMPFISMYFHYNTLLYSSKIQNIKDARDMNLYANIEGWYLDDKASPSQAPVDTQLTDTPTPAETPMPGQSDTPAPADEPEESNSPGDTPTTD